MLLFSGPDRKRVRNGEIRLTFRAWMRPQVRQGGTYRFDGERSLHVDSLTLVAPHAISDDESLQAGFADRDALLAFLTRDGRAVPDSLYRVEFSVVEGAEPQPSNDRFSSDEIEQVVQRLRLMDARSGAGQWTRQTLALIGEHPRLAARRLAEMSGRDTLPFKADVRRLKKLGLTHSHEVGYELTPRGQQLLAYLSREA
jgi:hypothetical protein